MKILVVHNRYQSRHIGGEDLVVAREIHALRQQLGEDAVMEYQVCNDDIQSRKLIFSLWGSREHYHRIYALIKKHRIDVVHVHNFFPLLTPLVLLAAKEAGAKVVQTLHNFRWWCLSGDFYRDDRGACEECVNRSAWSAVRHRCYRGSLLQSTVGALAFSWYRWKQYEHCIDAYFVLSRFQQEKVKQWLPEDKLWLKPNGIVLPRRGELSHPKRDFLFVGRLEAGKGIEWLLSVWDTLPDHYILNVIGSGDDPSLETRYKKDNIRFWGKQPHEAVLLAFQRAKYCIHPSLTYETFGLTLVEALAHKTPVIALNRGPRSEWIRTGWNGWLCEQEGLRAAVIEAIESTDEATYEQLSENAYQSVEALGLETVTTQQIALYEKIANI